MTGVPQAIASIMTRPNGSGQIDREQKARGAAEQVRLAAFADLTEELDLRMGHDHRADCRFPVSLVDTVDLGRDPQRQAAAHCDLNRLVGPLLGRNPTEESQVPIGIAAERKEMARKSVMDSTQPARIVEILLLAVRDRNERKVAKRRIEWSQIRQIQPAVQSGQRPLGEAVYQRSVKHIDVKVQDIELVDPTANLLEHDHVVGQSVAHHGIEAQRHFAAGHQPGRSPRVAARKECHLMPLADELFSQKRNHSLCAAIEPGRHAFVERCNLGDPHRQLSEDWLTAARRAKANVLPMANEGGWL
jgi:hypothetical protein